MTTKPPIDAVALMRSIRAKLDEEYEGLTLEERVARMRERIHKHPVLRRWVERSKTKSQASS